MTAPSHSLQPTLAAGDFSDVNLAQLIVAAIKHLWRAAEFEAVGPSLGKWCCMILW